MKGSPGTRQGNATVSPVNRAAQTVFILSVGGWKDAFESSLLTPNTTDLPQETLLPFCADMLPSPCFARCSVRYQIAIDLLSLITLQPCGCKQQLGNLSCAPGKHASKTTAPSHGFGSMRDGVRWRGTPGSWCAGLRGSPWGGTEATWSGETRYLTGGPCWQAVSTASLGGSRLS